MRLIDADALLTDRRKRMYYHLPNGDTAIPIIDIEHAPTIEERKWIPCSERLPEKCKEVLVCYDFKGHRSVLIGTLYGDESFHGYDDEYLTSEGRRYRKAVAWMPLPEPYREKYNERT